MNAPSYAIAPDVVEALDQGIAVVALESTLVAHGLPWPTNLETALEAENLVRKAGAVPATMAVLGGRIRVGLTHEKIEQLAKGGKAIKATRRDLAAVLARGGDAATTVSATTWIARQVGINTFATGGLGGVHRDAARSFDVSNDLDELARADGFLVVCSGVKAILDVPATLEALETRGVVVLGYRTDTLPAFLEVSSGLPLDVRVDTLEEVSAIVSTHRTLGLPGAIVLAQAVPEADALDHDELEKSLEQAEARAQEMGITGKALTPALLGQIHQTTGGRSLRANRSLILANATLAAEVSVKLARLEQPETPTHPFQGSTGGSGSGSVGGSG